MSLRPLLYRSDIEHRSSDEEETIKGIIKGMTHQSEIAAQRQSHTTRASHAKSTAVLKGTLEIDHDLPVELAQGLFASGGTYPVAIRFAQGPGEILSDKVSTHRGMSLKIFDVHGEKMAPYQSDQVQDFILASGPVFPSGTAQGFLRDGKMLETATPLPEIVKSGVASVARSTNAMLQALGTESPLADFFGHPFTHPLSEPYFSQVPLRYGDYVAKLAAFPAAGKLLDSVKAKKIDTAQDDDAFRTAMVDHFALEGFVFELCAQLWNNEQTQSIEDASKPWLETESPYKTVGKITIPSQSAHSSQRSKYFDDVLSFYPGRTLVSHQPLGSVMRARLQVYPALSQYRHEQNGIEVKEPRAIGEIPD